MLAIAPLSLSFTPLICSPPACYGGVVEVAEKAPSSCPR